MAYLAVISGEDVAQIIVIPEGVTDKTAFARTLGITAKVVPCEKMLSSIGMKNVDDKLYPIWRQTTGAGDDPLEIGETGFPENTEVWWNGKIWKSTIGVNVWEPGVTGWREAGTAPEWRQPTGSVDAYKIGEIVSYAGFIWVSNYNANVWAPGVFGWVKQ